MSGKNTRKKRVVFHNVADKVKYTTTNAPVELFRVGGPMPRKTKKKNGSGENYITSWLAAHPGHTMPTYFNRSNTTHMRLLAKSVKEALKRGQRNARQSKKSFQNSNESSNERMTRRKKHIETMLERVQMESNMLELNALVEKNEAGKAGK